MIALIDRALKLTNVEDRSLSIQEAKNILKNNNYPEHLIQATLKQRVHILYNSLSTRRAEERTARYASIAYIPCLSEKVGKALRKHDIIAAHQPTDKIKTSLFTMLKDKIPKTKQTNVVYSIPCGACEDKEYIGQTSQTLEKRLAQHRNSIRTNTSSTGLTQHAREQGHHFDFEKTSILERIGKEEKRLTAEMLHIKLKERRAVNLQRDGIGLSNTYNGLLCKLRDERQQTHSKKGTSEQNKQ